MLVNVKNVLDTTMNKRLEEATGLTLSELMRASVIVRFYLNTRTPSDNVSKELVMKVVGVDDGTHICLNGKELPPIIDTGEDYVVEYYISSIEVPTEGETQWFAQGIQILKPGELLAPAESNRPCEVEFVR